MWLSCEFSIGLDRVADIQKGGKFFRAEEQKEENNG